MKAKPFTIFKQPQKTKTPNLWLVHRRYDTIAKMQDAMRELTKRPRKLRYFIYLPLPSVHPTAKGIEFKEDMQIHAK